MTTQTVTPMYLEVMPPSNIEAEEALLGSVMIDPTAMRRILAIVKPSDFYLVRNQWMFDAMLRLHKAHMPIDAVTVRKELDAAGQLAEFGGPAQITYYMTVTPTAIHAEGYAQIVKDMAVRRGLISVASDIAKNAYDLEAEAQEQTAKAFAALRTVNTYNAQSADIGTVAGEVFDELSYWSEHPIGKNEVRGLKTYIPALDMMIGGIEPDDLIINAARPGVGKSAFAGIIAYEKAKRGERVLYFSLEMSQKRIIRRIASRLARVPYDKAKRGQCDSDELSRLMQAAGHIAELPLIVRDQSGITTAQIDAAISQLMPLDMVIIDNINIIGDPKEKGENRATQVGRISANLKNMARNYNVPVWCICHMNRDIERRADGVPTLADLKESGDIEQNADNVLFMYTAKEDIKQDEHDGAIITLLPAKLRDGNTDAAAKLYFNKPIQDFAPTTTREVRL